MSLFEDGLVMGTMWLATQYPLAFGVALVIALGLSICLLVVLIRFLKGLVRRVRGWFGEKQVTPVNG